MGEVFEKIYEEVKKIPFGETRTYGYIAAKAKTTPRVVGFALHKNPSAEDIPCHRVVNRYGQAAEGYAFGGKKCQEKKLEDERKQFFTKY